MADREARTERSIQHDLSARRPGTGSVDRRDHHADLSDLHLRPGRARPAQGLRVRPHAEPDARRARGQPRRHRGRARRRSPSRRAWRPSTRSRRCSRAATTSSCPTTSTAARSGCSTRCCRATSCRSRYVDTADLGPRRAGVHAGDQAAVRRNAEQPGDAADRSRAPPPTSRTPAACGWSSTTRSRARACSGRSSSAPISSPTARRNT